MQLYLIRHAESVNNAVPTYQRSEDPPITAVGRLQSQCLARWLKTLPFDALITSPFLRTLQTTQAVLGEKSSAVSVWNNVFERGGCYRGYTEKNIEAAPGLGRSSIERHLQEHADSVRVDDSISEKGWWAGQVRESNDRALRRTSDVERRLIDEFTEGESVVMITHADFKRLMLVRLIGGSIDASQVGPLRNTGVTRIDYENGRWRLDFLNSVSHLPARLITGKEH